MTSTTSDNIYMENHAVAALLDLQRGEQRAKPATRATEDQEKPTSLEASNVSSESVGASSMVIQTAADDTNKRPHPEQSSSSSAVVVTASRKKRQKRRKRTQDGCAHQFPVQPRVIQVCKLPKTYVDHSYRDFSNVPREATMAVEEPFDISKASFGRKLHHMLMSSDCRGIITWMHHGRAFRILVPKKMEQDMILKRYFGHSRYSTFLSQLKNNGLKMMTRGRDRNCFYHECLLRGLPHLTKYMPAFKEGRRLMPDPTNEPDFYAISARYPVPEHNQQPQHINCMIPHSTPAQHQPPHNLTTLFQGARSDSIPHPLANLIPRSAPQLAAHPTVGGVPTVGDETRDLLQTLRILAGDQQQQQRVVAEPPPQALNTQNLLHQAMLHQLHANNMLAATLVQQQQQQQQQPRILSAAEQQKQQQLNDEVIISALLQSLT